jgi:hypothetical protein
MLITPEKVSVERLYCAVRSDWGLSFLFGGSVVNLYCIAIKRILQ